MTDTPEQKEKTPKLISRKEYIAFTKFISHLFLNPRRGKARLETKIGRLKNRIYKLRTLYGSIDFNYKNPEIIIK